MSIEPVPTLTPDAAERLTLRIRLAAGNVREGLEKLYGLVQQAKEGGAHAALGFASWTAYLADVFGEQPLRLGRDERRELVDYLASEGMSTRAIAPIAGVSHETVRADAAVKELTPTPTAPAPIKVTETTKTESFIDPVTGEITDQVRGDAPGSVGEAAPVEPVSRPAPSKVIGLDGKTYARPEPKPRDYAQENAEQHCAEFANALDVLWTITIPEAFDRSFKSYDRSGRVTGYLIPESSLIAYRRRRRVAA